MMHRGVGAPTTSQVVAWVCLACYMSHFTAIAQDFDAGPATGLSALASSSEWQVALDKAAHPDTCGERCCSRKIALSYSPLHGNTETMQDHDVVDAGLMGTYLEYGADHTDVTSTVRRDAEQEYIVYRSMKAVSGASTPPPPSLSSSAAAGPGASRPRHAFLFFSSHQKQWLIGAAVGDNKGCYAGIASAGRRPFQLKGPLLLPGGANGSGTRTLGHNNADSTRTQCRITLHHCAPARKAL